MTIDYAVIYITQYVHVYAFLTAIHRALRVSYDWQVKEVLASRLFCDVCDWRADTPEVWVSLSVVSHRGVPCHICLLL